MKKVTTELSKDSVTISVSSLDQTCVLELPVKLISPQVSLQIAGMISSDPTYIPVIPKLDEKDC